MISRGHRSLPLRAVRTSYQGRISYGERFDNGFEMLISASGYDSDGNGQLYYAEFDDPASNNGIAENADDATNRNLFAKLSYDDFTLSVKGYPVIKKKTARKRLNRYLKMTWNWCKENRHDPLRDQYQILCAKLRGYYQYFGV
ncbi:MAG: hypothetical protein JMN29_18010, partial [gamma proteobacterium endosymbiont of Lamellibrachia anaximandri]|nr:hypothetical protein [gamma proteobacterium endosymbiont of Lamellibrachia anaximandri]